jgi:hypothetical protein
LSSSARKSRLPPRGGCSEWSTFTHPEAGVQFGIAEGLEAKPDGEVITTSSADGGLQVVFWVPDENTFDAAVKELWTKNWPRPSRTEDGR